MSLKVVIPAPLRKYTGGAEIVEVEAGTVQEVIDRLESKHPGIRNSVCSESGELRRFINIYVDGEDVRFLDNLKTVAKDGSEISIVPAISGGLSKSRKLSAVG
jgi:molybdopterin converting factor small subunit